MTDDSDDFPIESIERVGETFELTHTEHENPVTLECVMMDIDVNAVTDALSDLADDHDLADDAVADIASASRSYNEIRSDIEALFSELTDDGFLSLLGDSSPDVETIRRWRRDHPETVDRFDTVADAYRTTYQKMGGTMAPVTFVENDFLDVHSDIVALDLLIKYGADK